MARKAASSRETPIEKPVAGTGSAAEARDEPVIAPAAADRAEAHRPAIVVLDLEGQLGLEDRAGVIFEPAHHGGVDADAIGTVARASNKALDLSKLFEAFIADALRGRIASDATANSGTAGKPVTIGRTLALRAIAKPYGAVALQNGEHPLDSRLV